VVTLINTDRCFKNEPLLDQNVLWYYARGGGKRSAVFVTECTMIEPTPLIRETEVA